LARCAMFPFGPACLEEPAGFQSAYFSSGLQSSNQKIQFRFQKY
jgi:hypothetical protein